MDYSDLVAVLSDIELTYDEAIDTAKECINRASGLAPERSRRLVHAIEILFHELDETEIVVVDAAEHEERMKAEFVKYMLERDKQK